MSATVDLYNSHYSTIHADIQQEIRRKTYGQDLGQTSWMTADECRGFLTWLNVSSSSRVLEIACGSGGTSMFIAAETGARVTGIDINEHAVVSANQRLGPGNGPGVAFRVADASQRLPFEDESFDAIFCNDSICHIPERPAVLREWARVLAPGGRLFFTDSVVVTGAVTKDEIAIRSSIGYFLFVPVGENERFLRGAGLELVRTDNVTESMAAVSRRWHDARAERRQALIQSEGEAGFEGLQRFLATVHALSSQGRLSRYAYLARKRP